MSESCWPSCGSGRQFPPARSGEGEASGAAWASPAQAKRVLLLAKRGRRSAAWRRQSKASAHLQEAPRTRPSRSRPAAPDASPSPRSCRRKACRPPPAAWPRSSRFMCLSSSGGLVLFQETSPASRLLRNCRVQLPLGTLIPVLRSRPSSRRLADLGSLPTMRAISAA